MTSFRRINLEKEVQVTEPKRTTFHSLVSKQSISQIAKLSPKDYKNVVYIGNDISYGDVFIAYNDDPTAFTIYFGEAGDEFKDNGE